MDTAGDASRPVDAPTTELRGVPKGKWDINVGLVGKPGCGKSTVAAHYMLELHAQSPCYLIAHDPEHALPHRLPDGRRVPIVRHETVTAAEAALRKGVPGIHAVACIDAVPVVQLAHRIGESSLAQRSNAPVLVLVDEVTNCKEMGANFLGPTMQAALTLRRHRHTGLLWTTQDPSLVHHQFISKATRLYVFRLESDPAIERLAKYSALPPNSAAQIKNLNRGEFLLVQPKEWDR